MTETNPQRARIFISYKRNVEPDEPVALQIFKALSQQYDIFIDQTMLVGTCWAERIEAELRQTDFLISFLSAESIHSEMVVGEIETAHRLAKEQGGRPAILPVRLAYREPFQYPLSAYLNPINWALWRSHEDTPRLIAELTQAICGGALTIDERSKASVLQASASPSMPAPLASAQPARLEMPEGTMDPQSAFYVERPGDRIALEAINHQGVIITIKGPRPQAVRHSASGQQCAARAQSNLRGGVRPSAGKGTPAAQLEEALTARGYCVECKFCVCCFRLPCAVCKGTATTCRTPAPTSRASSHLRNRTSTFSGSRDQSSRRSRCTSGRSARRTPTSRTACPDCILARIGRGRH
jgi:TIR domain-containing protein